MHFSTPRLRPAATLTAAVIIFSALVLPALATPSTDLIIPEAPPKDLAPRTTLVRRAEEAGAGCSTEGQWHCMTNSFQRCAGGHWSVEMAMSEGTRCTPSGYTDDWNFKIEHDDDRDDNDDDNKDDGEKQEQTNDGGSSKGRPVSRTTAVAILGLWAAAGFLV